MTLQEKLRPHHTALIAIDIQNDFCAPTGVMAKMGKDVAGMDKLVDRLQSFITICGDNQIPVFYTQQIYDRGKLNELQKEQYDLDGKLITCDVHGDGFRFYRLNPPNEQVYQKYNYNIFSNAKLIDDLATANIKTLIVTGVSTQICVETAIRNGFDLGYKIVVPSDLVGTTSNDLDAQSLTLKRVKKTFGVVSNLKEITRIITGNSRVAS